MARCRSWRPTTQGLEAADVGEPGVSHLYWKPCRNKVDPGQVRCQECYGMLAGHRDVQVRRHLAGEDSLPAQILEQLLTDPDVLVAGLAGKVSDGT